MVVIQGLALLGEVTVGLDAVLEAVELEQVNIRSEWRSDAPLATASFSLTARCVEGIWELVGEHSPPSKSLQFGNRPGRLDAYKVSINKEATLRGSRQTDRVHWRRLLTVQTDDFSHG